MKTLVSDALWARVQPLLPPPHTRRFRFPGRKPLDYRRVLTGILFFLRTGMAWDDLPAELGCGCGKTCRQYLRTWHQAGVWVQLHALLLAELNGAGDGMRGGGGLIPAGSVRLAVTVVYHLMLASATSVSAGFAAEDASAVRGASSL